MNPKGQIHVDNKLKSIQSQLDQGEEVNGGLLTYLLVSKELTLEEIYANMTEMLLAGVDTVSLLSLLLCTMFLLISTFHIYLWEYEGEVGWEGSLFLRA